MKSKSETTLICFVFLILFAGFSGINYGQRVQIDFQDGSSLSAKLETNDSEYFYSYDINKQYLRKENNTYTYLWSKMKLTSISEMEFLPLTDIERSRIGTGEGSLPTSVVKANIKFRNGEVKNKIYVILGLTRWVSENEKGDLFSPLIKRVIFK